MSPSAERNAWLATRVAGFALMAASLALRWWVGARIALAIGLAFSLAFWRLHGDVERERRRWQRTLEAMLLQPAADDDAPSLLRRADAALYAAKSQGRACCAFAAAETAP